MPERPLESALPRHSETESLRTIDGGQDSGNDCAPAPSFHGTHGTDPAPGADGNVHIAIIGSGAGAVAAAIRATEAGAHVTMIESGQLGGTCVNVGCVPSKIMLRAGQLAHQGQDHPFDGIPRSHGPIARERLMAQLRARVDELRQAKYRDILDNDDRITYRAGRARFEDPHTLTVSTREGDTVRIRADRILIATGASPAVPAIPGLASTPWWTSTDALFSEAIPERLAVVGSSLVAVEIAQAYRRLGSQVTILARGALLSRWDPEIGGELQADFEAEDIRILNHARIDRVAYADGRFTISTGHGAITSDRLLVDHGAVTEHRGSQSRGGEGGMMDFKAAILRYTPWGIAPTCRSWSTLPRQRARVPQST